MIGGMDKVYTTLVKHRRIVLAIWLVVTFVGLYSLSTIRVSEDISDFFKSGKSDTSDLLEIYSRHSGADRFIALVDASDRSEDGLGRASETAELFVDTLSARLERAGYDMKLTGVLDYSEDTKLLKTLYEFGPQLVTAQDIAEAKSRLSDDSFLSGRMALLKKRLSMPGGGGASLALTEDPLGVFSFVPALLGSLSRYNDRYTVIDGTVFTPDSSFAVITGTSVSGAAESRDNGVITEIWRNTAEDISNSVECAIYVTGGPVIAADNAGALKSDTIWLFSIALIVMTAVLVYTFRRMSYILLIVLSITWGWLAALAVLTILFDTVSLIVLAMGSVVIGISVNYPIHFIDHLRGLSDRSKRYAEVAAPLLTGNITTIAAFLVLLLLGSDAMLQLGVFGASMLCFTILFVLLVLPVIMPAGGTREKGYARLLDRIASWSPGKIDSKLALSLFLILTVVLGCLSLDSSFSKDFSSVNYMTDLQVELQQRLQGFKPAAQTGIKTFTVATEGESYVDAIDNYFSSGADTIIAGEQDAGSDMPGFVSANDSCQVSLERWYGFTSQYGSVLSQKIVSLADSSGLTPAVFDNMLARLDRQTDIFPVDSAGTILTSVFPSNFLTLASGRKVFLVNITVPDSVAQDLCDRLDSLHGVFVFDDGGVIESLTSHLTDDFNLVGILCAAVVFLFLWLSLRSLKYTLAAFLPMAVAWLWILGIMNILGMEFNAVTIILATFIFGQGDDYTLFITEGLMGKARGEGELLADYKRSVLISAIMMFTGMAVLIPARHPALSSLGIVSVLGMAVVLVMAWIVPPMVIRLFPKKLH